MVNSGRDLTDKSSDDNGQGSAGDPFDSDNATIPLTITISVLLRKLPDNHLILSCKSIFIFLATQRVFNQLSTPLPYTTPHHWLSCIIEDFCVSNRSFVEVFFL